MRGSMARTTLRRSQTTADMATTARFNGFPLTAHTSRGGEQSYVAASRSSFALALDGGAVAVVPFDGAPAYSPDLPVVRGLEAPVYDLAFSAFDERLLAAASADGTVKMWRLPDGGLTEDLTVASTVLAGGHSSEVTHARFHPTDENLIASASLSDAVVNLWDVGRSAVVASVPAATDSFRIHDLAWDAEGSKCAMCNSRDVRVMDPRSSVAAARFRAHEGAAGKPMKLAYLGSMEMLLTTGFGPTGMPKCSGRQFRIWDPRNTALAVKCIDMPGTGVLKPFWDEENRFMYIASLHNGNILAYEPTAAEDWPTLLFRHKPKGVTASTKGVAMVPTGGLRTETARFVTVATYPAQKVKVKCRSLRVERSTGSFHEGLSPRPGVKSIPSFARTERGSTRPPSPGLGGEFTYTSSAFREDDGEDSTRA
mmetsp:Transcript_10915/g.37031  ORF Transcript_10915/g.37031 Transcript_10915/m.37031 type:complete len:425 (-) Transcript_10915:64-1338(-)